jgi:hypothetical protein
MGLLMQTGPHAPKLVALLPEFVFNLLAARLHISANYNQQLHNPPQKLSLWAHLIMDG